MNIDRIDNINRQINNENSANFSRNQVQFHKKANTVYENALNLLKKVYSSNSNNQIKPEYSTERIKNFSIENLLKEKHRKYSSQLSNRKSLKSLAQPLQFSNRHKKILELIKN